jgi:hypothetical protein
MSATREAWKAAALLPGQGDRGRQRAGAGAGPPWRRGHRPGARPGARALADWFVAPETQRRIGEFGRSRFGQSLFVPDAGKPDRW